MELSKKKKSLNIETTTRNILFWDKNSIFYLIEKYLLQLAMWQPTSQAHAKFNKT